MEDPIEFVSVLSESDWEPNLKGWRCSALAIPGAEVTLLVGGSRLDPDHYQINRALRLIKWIGRADERPTLTGVSMAAVIQLTKRLTSVSVPVIVAIIGALATLGSALITATVTGDRDRVPPSITTTNGTAATTTTESSETAGIVNNDTTETDTTQTDTTEITDTGTTRQAPPQPFTPVRLTRENIERCVHRGGDEPDNCFMPDGSVITPPPGGGRARAIFRVPARARWFVAGLTEYSGTSCSGGNAKSLVLLDDQVIEPGFHMGGTTTQNVRIPIPHGTTKLELRTVDNDGTPYCDDVMWVNARFE